MHFLISGIHYRVYMKEIKLSTIAALTGFSVKHVSRALSGSGRVAPESRRLIQEAAQKLNYRKERAPTGRIAVISAFYFHWVEKVIDLLNQRGLEGVFFRFEYINELPENLFDGAIAICSRDLLGHEWHRKFNIPLVLVHDYSVYSESISAVFGDFDADLRLAISHLAGLGHQRIVWFRENWAQHGKRFVDRGRQGFYTTAARYGIEKESRIIDFYGASQLPGMLDNALNQNCTAFIINLYRNYQSLIDFFNERAIRIPEDVSLIVYDGDDTSGCTDPPLSALRISYERINELAVNMLLENSRAVQRPRQIAVPGVFIDRGSTGNVKEAQWKKQ